MRPTFIAALTLPVLIAAPAGAQPAERPRVELMARDGLVGRP